MEVLSCLSVNHWQVKYSRAGSSVVFTDIPNKVFSDPLPQEKGVFALQLADSCDPHLSFCTTLPPWQEVHQQPFKRGVPSALEAKISWTKILKNIYIWLPCTVTTCILPSTVHTTVYWISTFQDGSATELLPCPLIMSRLKVGNKHLQLYFFFFFSLRLPCSLTKLILSIYADGSKINCSKLHLSSKFPSKQSSHINS